jgi:hypothetical protein
MPVRTGNRYVQVWSEYVWITILAGDQQYLYRVLPPSGGEFLITANSEQECLDKITQELRRRHPRAP